MPGPARKPTALKLLDGTFRPDRAPKNEPKPVCKVQPPPAYLDGEARSKYLYLQAELEPLGVLTGLDQGILVSYCLAWGELTSTANFLKRCGKFKGDQLRPEVYYLAKKREEVRRLGAELGLSPASRARVEVPPPIDDEEDPLAEFE